MFKNYSSTYANIIALATTPLLADILSGGCAEEVGVLVGKYSIIAILATLGLAKRWFDGKLGSKEEVSILGVRK